MQVRNIVSTLFLTESHYNLDLLIVELLNVFENESDRQAASLFLNWFRQLREHGRIDAADYDQLEVTYSSVEEARTMLITALEKERKQIREEGREEGQKNERVAMIVRILQHNFGVISETIPQQLSLCTLNQLQPLINLALDATDLEEFLLEIPDPVQDEADKVSKSDQD